MAHPNQNQLNWRTYSGDTPTPFYLNMNWYNLFESGGMDPRPDATVVAGGDKVVVGNVDIVVPDEKTIFAPVPWTIVMTLRHEQAYQITALGNPLRFATWTVANQVFAPVATTAVGNRINTAGTAIPAVVVPDQEQLDYLFNIEIEYAVAPGGSGSALYKRMLGMSTTNITDQATSEGIQFTISGQRYGGVEWNTTGFTAGTDATL